MHPLLEQPARLVGGNLVNFSMHVGRIVLLAADLLKTAGLDTYTYERRGRKKSQNRLLVPVRSKVGSFKILIFPHRQGAEMPRTTWARDRSTLTVETDGQIDVFTFTMGADGRTRMAVARNRKRILDVK